MNTKEKISTIFKIFGKIIKTPKSIFWVLKDETSYENQLRRKYGRIQFPSVDINQFLIEGRGEISTYTFLSGSSLVTDLVLLKSLAQSIPDCNYLEIGMWRGESIVNVAETATHCTSVNLSPEEMIRMGLPPKYAQLHGCLVGERSTIQIIHANSLKFDFSTLNSRYDLIFVDGDHKYEAVKSDTEKVFSLLRNDDSMIVWHDYGYDPETPRYSVIAAILDGLPPEEHQYLYHVSNTMCAIYTKKKMKSSLLDSPVTPDKIFCVQLKTSPLSLPQVKTL